MFLLPLRFHAVADNHDTAVGAGYGAFHSDQIVLSVNFGYHQVLNSHLLRTHVAGQSLALEHAGRIGNGAVGAGMAGHRAGTMGFLQAVQTPALDCAGIALTFAGAGHIDLIAHCKDVGLDQVAYVVSVGILQAEFAESSLGSHIALCEMTLHGLVHAVGLQVAEARIRKLDQDAAELFNARGVAEAAARLPVIELRAPERVIGHSTRAAMQSGVVLGEAARIDGLSEIAIFFKVYFPVMRPTYAAAAIITFMGSWNNFLWPLVALQTPEMRTVPLVLSNMGSSYTPDYGMIMCGIVIATLPTAAIFFLMQKYFVAGMVGAVK